MLKRGEVVKDRWRIEQRLGKGTFCELHRASDLTNQTEGAAVKVEVQGMQRSVLKVFGSAVLVQSTQGKLLRERKMKEVKAAEQTLRIPV